MGKGKFGRNDPLSSTATLKQPILKVMFRPKHSRHLVGQHDRIQQVSVTIITLAVFLVIGSTV